MGFLPDDFAAKQQAKIVLQDRDHVGCERAVRAPAEVRDVDRDAAARFEHAHAVGEDVGEHLAVLVVARGDVTLAERLFVFLAGEVRWRRDHQRH